MPLTPYVTKAAFADEKSARIIHPPEKHRPKNLGARISRVREVKVSARSSE
jgi:hypothetical protein